MFPWAKLHASEEDSTPNGKHWRYWFRKVDKAGTSTGTGTETAQMASYPLPVGTGDRSFAGTIPGDYTRPAFARFSGKSVLFWSGPAVLAEGRNLYVTTVPSATDPVTTTPTTQSGCAAVDDPRRGEADRIPGAAALLLPAALLALRKAARKAFAR